MNKFAQFYTTDVFSDLLIKEFKTNAPKKVLELGVGSGSLIRSAIKRWDENPKYIAADIDSKNYAKVTTELPFIAMHKADGLSPLLPQKINVQAESVDVAICNPPYLKVSNNTDYQSLFEEAAIPTCIDLKYLTTDVVFLAQNIRLLKKKGELGIILPDTLITGQNFSILRQAILKSHTLKGVIQLPESIFSKTQASTHIVLIEKGGSTPSRVPLYISNRLGACIDVIDADSNKLEERMDYKYHKWNLKSSVGRPLTTFKNLGIEIKRGIYTHAELKAKKKRYIHTTNMPELGGIKAEKSFKNGINSERYAHKHDILIARVGRTAGKLSIVKKGSVLISDCVYRVTIPKSIRQIVWEQLSSEKGLAWFKANKKGVCAKVISKEDLLNFPIEF